MDLYQLRYFLEVARELSFTRAAANLHVSPPAVSRSVRLLEGSVKRRLFHRTRRRVSLTADGELLKERVQRIFDQVAAARAELEDASGATPAMIRVGSREMITDYLLTRPLLAFRERFPATRFGLYELDPREMVDALKKDRVDIGLYYSAIQDPALEVRRLGRLTSHIYGSRRAYPPGRRPRGFKQLLKEPFVAPRYYGADPAMPSPDGFPDHEYPRRILYDAEFLETHRRFVLDGLAVGVLPDLVFEREWREGLLVRFPGPRLYRDIFLHRRRERPLPRAVDYFCGVLATAIRRRKIHSPWS